MRDSRSRLTITGKAMREKRRENHRNMSAAESKEVNQSLYRVRKLHLMFIICFTFQGYSRQGMHH